MTAHRQVAERASCPVCGLTDCIGPRDLSAPREDICPLAAQHAKTISREVWHQPYIPGRGPMHHAGGPYTRGELLKRAAKWERMAMSARVCARGVPDA